MSGMPGSNGDATPVIANQFISISFNVGPMPTVCDHCGAPTVSIGLFAPICTVCGQFSVSHIEPRLSDEEEESS